MAGSIRFHGKHGLNPTMPVCFWCEKPTGEVALLGSAYKEEAPQYMVIDYMPCDECKARFKQGILLVECTHTPNKPGQPPIQPGHPGAYPTGRYVVCTEDAVRRGVQPERLATAVLRKRMGLVEPEAFNRLVPPVDTEQQA